MKFQGSMSLLFVAFLSPAIALGEAPTSGISGSATPEPSWPIEGRQGYVRLDGGFASAVGVGGISFGYSPIEVFAVEAGFGFGGTGLQFSLMPRLQLGTAADRFLLGVGASIGVAPWVTDPEVVPWINVEVGYEHRWDFGLCVSLAVGYTHSLTEFVTEDDGDEGTYAVGLPQARIGIGYWF